MSNTFFKASSDQSQLSPSGISSLDISSGKFSCMECFHLSHEKEKRLPTDHSVRRRSIFSPRYHFSLPIISVTHSRRPLCLRPQHFPGFLPVSWVHPRKVLSNPGGLTGFLITVEFRSGLLGVPRSPRLLAGDGFLAVLFPHTSRELSESS